MPEPKVDRRVPKWWPKSKTVWVNLVGLVAGILLLTSEFVATIPDAPEWLVGGVAMALSITNLVLRFLRSSTQAVSLTNPEK